MLHQSCSIHAKCMVAWQKPITKKLYTDVTKVVWSTWCQTVTSMQGKNGFRMNQYHHLPLPAGKFNTAWRMWWWTPCESTTCLPSCTCPTTQGKSNTAIPVHYLCLSPPWNSRAMVKGTVQQGEMAAFDNLNHYTLHDPIFKSGWQERN
jgi:hypothetical protein